MEWAVLLIAVFLESYAWWLRRGTFWVYISGVMAVTLTDDNFEEEVLRSELPVLVDFWAPWCGPCQMLGPVVEELAKEFEGKVKICKLNVDEGLAAAQKYGVMSIPTLIIFKDGEEVERLVGVRPKEMLAEKLASLVV